MTWRQVRRVLEPPAGNRVKELEFYRVLEPLDDRFQTYEAELCSLHGQAADGLVSRSPLRGAPPPMPALMASLPGQTPGCNSDKCPQEKGLGWFWVCFFFALSLFLLCGLCCLPPNWGPCRTHTAMASPAMWFAWQAQGVVFSERLHLSRVGKSLSRNLRSLFPNGPMAKEP